MGPVAGPVTVQANITVLQMPMIKILTVEIVRLAEADVVHLARAGKLEDDSKGQDYDRYYSQRTFCAHLVLKCCYMCTLDTNYICAHVCNLCAH